MLSTPCVSGCAAGAHQTALIKDSRGLGGGPVSTKTLSPWETKPCRRLMCNCHTSAWLNGASLTPQSHVRSSPEEKVLGSNSSVRSSVLAGTPNQDDCVCVKICVCVCVCECLPAPCVPSPQMFSTEPPNQRRRRRPTPSDL